MYFSLCASPSLGYASVFFMFLSKQLSVFFIQKTQPGRRDNLCVPSFESACCRTGQELNCLL